MVTVGSPKINKKGEVYERESEETLNNKVAIDEEGVKENCF